MKRFPGLLLVVFAVGCAGSGAGRPPLGGSRGRSDGGLAGEAPRSDTPALRIGFEGGDTPLGAAPGGWTPDELHGGGDPATWVVEDDRSAPFESHVLVVHATNPESTFNQCVLAGFAGADMEVAVNLKPLLGKLDQGGGVMLRFRDRANFILARWNPLESTVRLYVVRHGERRVIGDAPVSGAPGWHRLGVTARGPAFEVQFDGVGVIRATNDELPEPGAVGLWSKSDATTAFDDFSVEALP